MTTDGAPGSSFPPEGGTVLRVLIVEDELLVALDLEMALEDAGHAVVGTATTADEAVAMAAEAAPDVMVVDMRLADGSTGCEAAERVRRRMAVDLIFASGNLDAKTSRDLGAFEPLALIDKPYSHRQVLRALPQAA